MCVSAARSGIKHERIIKGICPSAVAWRHSSRNVRGPWCSEEDTIKFHSGYPQSKRKPLKRDHQSSLVECYLRDERCGLTILPDGFVRRWCLALTCVMLCVMKITAQDPCRYSIGVDQLVGVKVSKYNYGNGNSR